MPSAAVDNTTRPLGKARRQTVIAAVHINRFSRKARAYAPLREVASPRGQHTGLLYCRRRMSSTPGPISAEQCDNIIMLGQRRAEATGCDGEDVPGSIKSLIVPAGRYWRVE